VRGDQVPGPGLGKRLERLVAIEAAAVRPDGIPEVVFVEHLDDLVPPVVALDEQTPGPLLRLFDEPRVAGQQDTIFAARDLDQVLVFGLGKVKNVEAEDLEPLGQAAEHAIGDEIHLNP